MKFKLSFLLLGCMALLVLSCAGPEVVSEPTTPPSPVIIEAPAELTTPAAEVSPEPEITSELPADYTIAPGEEETFTLEAEDANSDILTFWATNLPPGATFDPETRTFSWTPNYGQAGVYTNICFYVSDGEYTDSECIKIYVLSANHAPILNPIPVTLAFVGEATVITLQASDPDGDELVFSAHNLPPNAQFSPPSFTWVPTEPGVWPAIYFTVSDGKLKTTRRAVIAVRQED